MPLGWSYDHPPAFDAGRAMTQGINEGYNTGWLLSGVPADQQFADLKKQILGNQLLEQEVQNAPQKLALLKEQISAQSEYRKAYAEQRKEMARKLADQIVQIEEAKSMAKTAEAMGNIPAESFKGIGPETMQFAAPDGTAASMLTPPAIEQIRGFQDKPVPQYGAVEQVRKALQGPAKGELMKLGAKERLIDPATGETRIGPVAGTEEDLNELDKARLAKVRAETERINANFSPREKILYDRLHSSYKTHVDAAAAALKLDDFEGQERERAAAESIWEQIEAMVDEKGGPEATTATPDKFGYVKDEEREVNGEKWVYLGENKWQKR